MARTYTFSATENADEVIKSFKKIQPDKNSFSGSLAIAMQEWMLNHKHDAPRITDYTMEGIIAIPHIYTDIDTWKKIVKSMDIIEKKQLHRRIGQLSNIVEKELGL